jgi:hypothetical protein
MMSPAELQFLLNRVDSGPTSEGTYMFEQEIELEKKEGSSFGPVLIIFLLIGLFVGGIGFVIIQSRQTVKPEEATAAIQTKLKAAPVSVTFRTGNVSNTSANDPQYKLLEKAGILKIGKGKGYASQVDLTPAGKELLASLPNVKGVPDSEKATIVYNLPLASRKLVSVGKVTKLNHDKVQVQYTWAWQTTKAGELFDIAGKFVQSLPAYNRAMLIDQHGANFYHSAPSGAAIVLKKGDEGWEPSAN